jgi:hypothetical protein
MKPGMQEVLGHSQNVQPTAKSMFRARSKVGGREAKYRKCFGMGMNLKSSWVSGCSVFDGSMECTVDSALLLLDAVPSTARCSMLLLLETGTRCIFSFSTGS